MSDAPVAIVTGASSGIGRAAAAGLVEVGYHVVLAARNGGKLEALAGELGRDRTTARPADVADADQVAALVQATVADRGRLDALVNVAGMAVLKPLAETTVEQWRDCFDVNVTGPFAAVRAAWPTFAKQKSGIVVNVSSMASRDPFPGFGAYASAKVAVNMLTLVTAREGKPIGVKAVCIAPGAVETPMLRGLFSPSQIPADQTLAPEDVAELICDCVTGRRAFEPGQTIFISR